MLLLTFRVAHDLYAVAAERVVEVVPRIELRPIPHAPESLAGLFNYRGKAVPVIDLGVLLGSTPCLERLHTRVILVDEPGGRGERLIGLVAENVSDVIMVKQEQVVLAAMNMEQAPYLGTVVRTEMGLVQVISVDKVLPKSLREGIFGPPSEAP
ncbi:chemotaxis protein CheW [Singulisphaera acidiphila]|uniref:Chemotaxis signal transduction protein n=1 Tax=Singulisphaera acidiphila (strain ATCC BAA-1392 / DSM 18658 / VKM B-2454 / MOB10) TaxID=886293 RepID=L0DJI8_SINAD|nr:chemotaxis protein CheW [Singulisphaera acidiphila]AGA28993.1 chemotaxis signal transduction protein [Singulisphaera acidiphila DSM 18658]